MVVNTNNQFFQGKNTLGFEFDQINYSMSIAYLCHFHANYKEKKNKKILDHWMCNMNAVE